MDQNNYFEEIKTWKPLSQMNDADEALYRERITKAYECILPHQELVRIPYVGKQEIVEYLYPELIAQCPVTFFPDIYNIKIRFVPNEIVPELKSLKFYFMDYYHLPISHEHIASKIYRDFNEQVKPRGLYIYLETNVRGGLITNIEIGDKI